MQHSYGQVTPEVAQEISAIVGPDNLIFGDEGALEDYGADEACGNYARLPQAVAKPASTSEISQLMELANRHRIPVVARGAGSGLSGGAVPLEGGLVLSLEKMNRILEIDPINRVAVVEPGVITNDLCRAVADQGLLYAGYPMSNATSFIGGNVATNAGGGKVIKYGSTRRHVLGLEVVLATGEVLRLGGKIRKDTWGYNLFHLVIGSEGTLGIVTEVTLNLESMPGKTVDLLVAFPDDASATNAVAKTIASNVVSPVGLEYMDKMSVELSTDYFNTQWPLVDQAGAFLIVTLEGKSKKDLEEQYFAAGDICLKEGALDVFVADSRSDSHNVWKVRQEWGPAIRAADPTSIGGSDVVLPLSQVPAFMTEIKRIAAKHHTKIPTIAHIGDGNFHSKPMRPAGMDVEVWNSLYYEIYDEMIESAITLGGAGSGEHGVGINKRKAFIKSKSPTELGLQRSIKAAFDPNSILNPGKII